MAVARRKKRRRGVALSVVFAACIIAISVTGYFAWTVVRQLGGKWPFTATASGTNDREGIYIDSGVQRAPIFDRSGTVLATTARVLSAYARPSLVPSGEDWMAGVSDILGVNQEELRRKISMTRNFVWLKTGISEADAERLKTANIPGVAVVEGFQRSYPYKNFATQVLGFVDQSGAGLEGVESFYDRRLDSNDCKDPEYPDCGLHLTIERGIQIRAEKELRRELERMRGEEGCMIIMGLETGEILAMAASPQWDLEKFWRNDQTGLSNYAIKAVVDPSMFLLFADWITHEGLASGQNDSGDTIPNTVTSGFNFVHVTNKFALFGPWTVEEIKAVNFNENMLNDMWALGFGQLTGIDLPNEDMGRLSSNRSYSWDDVLQQGMAASPLQMLRAFSALINFGKLVQPHVAFEYPRKGRAAYWDCGLKTVQGSVPTMEALTFKFRERLSQSKGLPLFTVRLHDETDGTSKGTAQIVSLGFWPYDSPVVSYILVMDKVKEDPVGYVDVASGIKRVAQAASRLPLDTTGHGGISEKRKNE